MNSQPTSNTETPLTDKAVYEATNRTVGKWIVPLAKSQYIEKKLHQLERELAERTKQRDEARDACSELVTDSNAITLARTIVRVTKERDEAREQRDKLAEALEYIIGIGYTTKTEAKAKKALNQPEP